jgi:hypothetical protein
MKVKFILKLTIYALWQGIVMPIWRDIIYPVYHYSGLAYIIAKTRSNKNEDDHTTLVIWLMGAYFNGAGFLSEKPNLRRTQTSPKLTISLA